ncbi:hypothetical protein [Priestia endophytica]|uniref:hypothetical protein n=1 Tax=Priestia endophytica TaxID=135735 RepID=UPI00124C7F2A|nr:hypothetical protein [Priestia endophytica]KAB2488197.1 hypothetical protein F8155_25275 [Priestia endophytica]
MEAVHRMIKPILIYVIVLLCLIGLFFFFKYAFLKLLGLLLLAAVFLVGVFFLGYLAFQVAGCLAVFVLPFVVLLIIIGAFLQFM